MSTYSGSFHVKNATGQAIEKGSVSHWTGDKKYSAQVVLDGLADGALTKPVSFTSETGVNDHWAMTMRMEDGGGHSVGDKQCNYNLGDAGSDVEVQLTPGTMTIVIGSGTCQASYS